MIRARTERLHSAEKEKQPDQSILKQKSFPAAQVQLLILGVNLPNPVRMVVQ